MVDLKKIAEALNRLLRPQTYPVAIRMCEPGEELPEKAKFPRKDLGISLAGRDHPTDSGFIVLLKGLDEPA